jgi:spore maturation protein CgeB
MGKKVVMGKTMKILMVSMEFDYGDPARGRSYEYYNFYQTLQGMGH